MKRRAFLGAIGGAAVAGPSVAKEAVSKASLAVAPSGGYGLTGYPDSVGEPLDAVSWAKERLKALMGRSIKEEERARRTQYIHELEPDVAALRSVNMRTRISMSKRMAYDREQREEYERLNGIIKGWW